MFRDVQSDSKDDEKDSQVQRVADAAAYDLFRETLTPGSILHSQGMQPASKPGWQWNLGLVEKIPDLNLRESPWTIPTRSAENGPQKSPAPIPDRPAPGNSVPWRGSPASPFDDIPGTGSVNDTNNSKPWRGSPQVPWDRVPGSEIDPQGPWDRIPGTDKEPPPPSKPWRGSPQVPWDRVPGSEIDPQGPWDRIPGLPGKTTDTASTGSPWRGLPSSSWEPIPVSNPVPRSDSRPSPQPLPAFEPRPVPRPVPAPADRVNAADEPWDKAPGAPWGKTPGRPGDNPQRPGDSSGFPGNSGSANLDRALKAFESDKAYRTSYSFNDAVDKFKALGKENEVALEMQMRDWLNKQNSMNPITHMRGTAVLASALGEFRLEEGSRIDLRSHQNSKPRILKGYAYDFGGEANVWLRMAAGSLVAAQQYVMGHKDMVVDGQKMDDAYMQQLKGLQKDVEKQLDIIYGPHDIEAVYAELRNQVRINSGDWQQGLVRLKRQLDEVKSPDNRYVAKAARDVAIGFLAEADYMSSRDNGEEAKIMFREANQYLAMSQRLDPSAQDFYPIQQISIRLKPQIQKSLDNQWNDPFNNPFEIPNPNIAIA